jgi:hypothetical protein
VRPFRADQVARPNALFAVCAGQCCSHAVGVLREADEPNTPFHLHAAHGELLAQNPLGRVLRDGDEAERHVGRQRHIELCRLLTVDVDDLAAHLDGRIENAAQRSHALEHLERARLHANGFRVLRRFEQRVHDAAVDAAAGQFDGGGQADGSSAGDEDLGVGHG